MARYEYDDEPPYLVVEKHEGSVGSFLIGVAIGAGIAMFLAPRSGPELRREVTTRARRVGRTFEQAKSEVEQRIDSARRAVEMRKSQVTRAMEAGRAAAQQARDELERRIAETKAAYTAGGDVARSGSRPIPKGVEQGEGEEA